jgi:hypothetical protein
MKYAIKAYNDQKECMHTERESTLDRARTAAKRLRSSPGLKPYFVQVTSGDEVVAHYERLKKT